jgi:hypothetical protein
LIAFINSWFERQVGFVLVAQMSSRLAVVMIKFGWLAESDSSLLFWGGKYGVVFVFRFVVVSLS